MLGLLCLWPYVAFRVREGLDKQPMLLSLYSIQSYIRAGQVDYSCVLVLLGLKQFGGQTFKSTALTTLDIENMLYQIIFNPFFIYNYLYLFYLFIYTSDLTLPQITWQSPTIHISLPTQKRTINLNWDRNIYKVSSRLYSLIICV